MSNQVYVLVLTIACCGGFLHGIAMAMRKYYGEGREKYWLEWKWWVGNGVDGFAGFCIWPAMPFVSVQILVPLIITIQLGSSVICGLVVFHEKLNRSHMIGLFCAVAGVIGISLSTSHEAAHFTIHEFWAGWVSQRFILTSCFVMASLLVCLACCHRATFWALLAAALEGFQYICSRSLVDSIFDYGISFLMQPAVLAAFAIKGSCILGIIVFSQKGLDTDLSRFAGIYLVGCVLFMCLYGWAFFGDSMPLSFTFAASTVSTLFGIYLLNQKEEIVDAKAKDSDPQEA